MLPEPPPAPAGAVLQVGQDVSDQVSGAGTISAAEAVAERRELSGRFPSRDWLERYGLLIDISLRVVMSIAFLCVACWWLDSVRDIMTKQADAEGGKKLSDTVLVTLLSTTTLNVLGLLYFVANYLFPKQKLGDAKPPEPPKL